MNRLKDWAVSVVRHGVDSKDESIRALRQELEGVREVCHEQEDCLKETQGEMKAHTLTSSVVQSDLDSWSALDKMHTHEEFLVRRSRSFAYLFLFAAG